jgi:phytoene synthase
MPYINGARSLTSFPPAKDGQGENANVEQAPVVLTNTYPVERLLSVRGQARAILGHNARSFRWASIFLPPGVRDDAAIVYAFCRLIDDTADNAADTDQAKRALIEIQTALYHPTGSASPFVELFFEVAHRMRIEPGWVEELIKGVRSDLGLVRIRDDDELVRYCYRVAGTVGLMMCRLMGVTDPRALEYAVALGIAMQLTNICRDVLEDGAANRVYLPRGRLQEVGVTQEQLVQGQANPEAVSRVVRDLLQLADSYYQRADLGIPFIPGRARLAIFVASRIYRAIGIRILNHLGGNPLLGRAVVPWYHKVYWLSAATFAWLGTIVSRKSKARELSPS